MSQLTLALLSAGAITSLAACGNVDKSSGPDAGADPGADARLDGDAPTDTVAPSVTSVTPADGAAGVAADAVIVLTFSEPMDRASVEAAWASTDLLATGVGFAWNAAGDTLTVTPDTPLIYATGTGTDPSVVEPRSYALEIASTATDVAGNPVSAAFTSGFTTKRRLRVDLAVIDNLTRTMRGDGLVLGTTAVNNAIGDTSGDLQYKTFVSYTLPQLPAGASLETATLGASQNGANGSPYLLGALSARHVNTAAIDAAAFNAIPLGDAGVLATDATVGARTLDVASQIADDLANHVARGERTQYRFEFPTATNSDGTTDQANFARASWSLRLSYLID